MRRIIIQSLAALGLGLLVAGIVFGSTVLSDDIRLIVLLGAIALLLCGIFAAAKIDRGWLVGALFCLPVCGLFAFFVLQQLPFLWPTLLIWLSAATIGLLFFSAPRRLIVIGLIALFIFSGWYCTAYIPNGMERIMTRIGNDSAPAFQFDPVSEGNVPRTAIRGKILVIDFFATWCRPCIDELPELRAIRDELQDRHDIEFVVVGTTAGGDTPEKLREFAKRRPIGLALAFDPGKKAHHAFGFTGFPSLVVIDRAGQARFKHEGYNTSEANFHRSLVQLLRSL
jgi:cytochrome c biogenesis protein CcmG/thiol:disulfide interchange protein DsbE